MRIFKKNINLPHAFSQISDPLVYIHMFMHLYKAEFATKKKVKPHKRRSVICQFVEFAYLSHGHTSSASPPADTLRYLCQDTELWVLMEIFNPLVGRCFRECLSREDNLKISLSYEPFCPSQKAPLIFQLLSQNEWPSGRVKSQVKARMTKSHIKMMFREIPQPSRTQPRY